MDRTWRLSSFLRSLLSQGRKYSDQSRAGFHNDLAALKRIAQMGSCQPHYVDLDPSQERLAEMVLKLEREVYGSKRPRQLAKRDVFVRIGDPIDLGRFVPCYLQDQQTVRRRVAEQLRDVIQNLIDGIVNPSARAECYSLIVLLPSACGGDVGQVRTVSDLTRDRPDTRRTAR